jgi:hypothetical protein
MLCFGRRASLTAEKQIFFVLHFQDGAFVEVTARNHFSVAISSELAATSSSWWWLSAGGNLVCFLCSLGCTSGFKVLEKRRKNPRAPVG